VKVPDRRVVSVPFPNSRDEMWFAYDGEMTRERFEHMKRFINELVYPWAEFAILEPPKEATP
jgi:hypothetical protein